MIAKLRGLLDSVGTDWAVIDVGGVGYLVFCSGRTLRSLPGLGETARLFTETHVREDHIHLYGFIDADERAWFRLLQKVQGVGARMALSILSVLSPGQIVQAIAAGDRAAFTQVSGIGPRTAARILAELKDTVASQGFPASTDDAVTTAPKGEPASEEAVSALVNLGYGRSEAFGAVAAASRSLGDDANLESLIRSGLKELAR
ncbi:MAG: Holliday junction branch migration protein RuvA [Rhodospirillaceae bacterium]|nr:Holliday junction branch migration protein RuvA [Rhodospirillaceae bacterium]